MKLNFQTKKVFKCFMSERQQLVDNRPSELTKSGALKVCAQRAVTDPQQPYKLFSGTKRLT